MKLDAFTRILIKPFHTFPHYKNTVIDNSQIGGDLSLDLDLAYITYFFLCTTLEVKLIE